MCNKRIRIYLKIIASMGKLLNERSMVGIGIIHNTKEMKCLNTWVKCKTIQA